MTNAVAMAAILAATGQAEAVRSGRGHRNRCTEDVREHPLCLVASRPDLRPVADDLYRCVADGELVLFEQSANLGKHSSAAHAVPFGPAGAENRTEVTEARRREQRVTQSVDGYVAVRMARAPVRFLEQQPGHPARTTDLDGMNIRAETDAHLISVL
ncbi:hypothetical protein GCM10020255_049960 [Rhodococcus baikonurensis]